MKSTKFKKFLACLLSVVCVTSLFAGCGNTEKETAKESSSTSSQTEEKVTTNTVTEKEEGVTYPLKLDKEVTLTIAMIEEAQLGTQGYKDLSETPFAEEWQRATGVNIKIEQYADGTAMNLMFAGGELPDIIYFNFNSYNGGITKALKDKIIEPLNEYMEYAPDFEAVLNSNESYMKSVTASDGSILGFPFIRGEAELLNSLGFIVRQDFLEQIGEEAPVTADDFYRVLKAFKEELNVEAPFTIFPSYLSSFGFGEGLLTSPFGLPKCDFYVDNDQVNYGYYKQEFKDVLAFMKKLYDEGLLDPNFATQDPTTMRSNIMNGVSGITMDTAGSGLGNALKTMADHPTFNLSGFSSLVAKEGDTAMSCMYDNPVTSYYAVITPTSKNKEVAIKFLNYGYTEEGYKLMNYGIEGENYTMVDGEVVFDKKFTESTDSNAMVGYYRNWSGFPFVQTWLKNTLVEQQIQAKEAWVKADVSKYRLPAVSVAEADSSEYSKIMGDVKTYTFEMAVRFITGLEDLDNFDSVYMTELKKMGVERAIEIMQAAYDEYNAR